MGLRLDDKNIGAKLEKIILMKTSFSNIKQNLSSINFSPQTSEKNKYDIRGNDLLKLPRANTTLRRA